VFVRLGNSVASHLRRVVPDGQDTRRSPALTRETRSAQPQEA
jgi:hypothetical protein